MNRQEKGEINEAFGIFRWLGAKTILYGLVGVLILGTLGFGIKFLFKPAEVLDKVTDPDRMIYTYEWFFKQKGQVDAIDVQIFAKEAEILSFKNSLPEDRKEWDSEDKRELERKNVELSGMKQHRATLVADYNARAANKTRSFLKDNSLPETLK